MLVQLEIHRYCELGRIEPKARLPSAATRSGNRVCRRVEYWLLHLPYRYWSQHRKKMCRWRGSGRPPRGEKILFSISSRGINRHGAESPMFTASHTNNGTRAWHSAGTCGAKKRKVIGWVWLWLSNKRFGSFVWLQSANCGHIYCADDPPSRRIALDYIAGGIRSAGAFMKFGGRSQHKKQSDCQIDRRTGAAIDLPSRRNKIAVSIIPDGRKRLVGYSPCSVLFHPDDVFGCGIVRERQR